MLRKGAFIFLLVVLAAIGYFSFSIYNKLQAKKEAEKKIASLPKFSVSTLKGKTQTVQAPLAKPLVVTYFSPECHFCQAEIRSMQKSDSVRQKAAVWLISDFPLDELKQFNHFFHVDTTQNMHIYRDSTKTVKKLFGVRGVPSTFVYGKDGRLLKSFEGETKAQVLYELVK